MESKQQPLSAGEDAVHALRANLSRDVAAGHASLVLAERLPLGIRLRHGVRRIRPWLVRGMILLLALVLAGLLLIQQDLVAREARTLPAPDVRIQLADDLPSPLPTPPLPAP